MNESFDSKTLKPELKLSRPNRYVFQSDISLLHLLDILCKFFVDALLLLWYEVVSYLHFVRKIRKIVIAFI